MSITPPVRPETTLGRCNQNKDGVNGRGGFRKLRERLQWLHKEKLNYVWVQMSFLKVKWGKTEDHNSISAVFFFFNERQLSVIGDGIV